MKYIKPRALLCLSALLVSCGGSDAQKQITIEEFLATARSYDKEKAIASISSAKETGRFLYKIFNPDDVEERREMDYPSESFQYLFFSYDETRTSMIYDGTYFFDKDGGPEQNTGLTFGFYETGSWLSKSADNAGGALSFKGTFEGELTLVNGWRLESPVRAKAECEIRFNAYGLHEKYSTVITVDGKEVYVYQINITYVYKN